VITIALPLRLPNYPLGLRLLHICTPFQMPRIMHRRTGKQHHYDKKENEQANHILRPP
jgi:hypothetical protein